MSYLISTTSSNGFAPSGVVGFGVAGYATMTDFERFVIDWMQRVEAKLDQLLGEDVDDTPAKDLDGEPSGQPRDQNQPL